VEGGVARKAPFFSEKEKLEDPNWASEGPRRVHVSQEGPFFISQQAKSSLGDFPKEALQKGEGTVNSVEQEEHLYVSKRVTVVRPMGPRPEKDFSPSPGSRGKNLVFAAEKLGSEKKP